MSTIKIDMVEADSYVIVTLEFGHKISDGNVNLLFPAGTSNTAPRILGDDGSFIWRSLQAIPGIRAAHLRHRYIVISCSPGEEYAAIGALLTAIAPVLSKLDPATSSS